MLLCISASNINAQSNQEEFTWPVTAQLLLTEDWVLDATESLAVVGDVVFTNGNENLQITVVPSDPYRISVVHIHVVRNPDDFESVLDSKGKPKPNMFDYKTDYVEDNGIPADSHSQVIPLDGFDICWAPDPETCPPNFYAIVHVELQEPVKKKWVDVPGDGWADNGGVVDAD